MKRTVSAIFLVMLLLSMLMCVLNLPTSNADSGWTEIESLNVGRAQATATLLHNGKVLVAGGYNSTDNLGVDSCELYDPSTGHWSLTGSMHQARWAFTATLLDNGKVLVTGGMGDASTAIIGSCELYDPDLGTWTLADNLNVPRYGHTATLLPNGDVIVAGGGGGDGRTLECELYDPVTDMWTRTGSLGLGRTNAACALLPNGKVLIAGGEGPTSECEVYDPSAGTWGVTGAMSVARNHIAHSGVLLQDGKFLVCGGGDAEYHELASCEYYDWQTGAWTLTGSLPWNVWGALATLLNSGKVLVSFSQVAALYDPGTGSWTSVNNLLISHQGGTATLLMNGQVLLAGGVGAQPIKSCVLFGQPNLLTITFTESGLPEDGRQWSVTFNGQVQTSTSNSITFGAQNGFYTFSITSPSGYSASPRSGGITVNEANVTQHIIFSPGLERPNIINQSQTWYGDFIINEGESVLIENCSLTIRDGEIWVYGNLTAINSRILIKENTFQKTIWVYGNFTLLNSKTDEPELYVYCYQNAIATIRNSELYGFSTYYSSVVIDNSSIFETIPFYGNTTITNTVCEHLQVFVRPSTHTLLKNVNVSGSDSAELILHLSGQDCIPTRELQVPNGQVDSWKLTDIGTDLDISFEHCFVKQTAIVLGRRYGDLCISNSSLEAIGLSLYDAPFGTCYNLTVKPGYTYNQNIFVDENINLTILNSTVNQWSIGIYGQGVYRFIDSDLDLSCRGHADISIINSNVDWVLTSQFNGNLCATNTTIGTLTLSIESGYMSLVLNEGYQELTQFCSVEQPFNITIVGSNVSHWGVGVYNDAQVTVNNTILTGKWPQIPGAGLTAMGNSIVRISNSNLDGVECYNGATLTTENSSINSLRCYDDSNFTAINSTINSIITDPVTITMINSTVFSEVQLSMPVSVYSSLIEESPIPLPTNLTRLSKYLTLVTIDYSGFLDAQIRIYYDKEMVGMTGVAEAHLKIYHLEKGSDQWQICSVQGVNVAESYVWANVTSFSCFTLGDGGSSALSGDINADGIVDIFDVATIALAFSSTPSDPNWNPIADINSDGLVDIFDLVVVALHFGETG